MIAKIFVDSDVVIDFFADREPFVNPASELFELNEQGKLQIYISALSINNVYYILKKYLNSIQAIEVIEELTKITEIVGVTTTEIIQALKNCDNNSRRLFEHILISFLILINFKN